VSIGDFVFGLGQLPLEILEVFAGSEYRIGFGNGKECRKAWVRVFSAWSFSCGS